MKKCGICIFGSWVVGLSTIGWAAVGLLGGVPTMPLPLRAAAIAVGVVALGFLVYQPPMKPCPRCVAANQ